MKNEIGFKFKPTFTSNIDFFEVRGFDEKTNKVLTTVHPHNGGSFDDDIEKPYYDAAFEVGEYIPLYLDKSTYIDCPFFLPWTNTSRGEIENACVCRKLRFIKRCDNCIEKDNYDGSTREKMIRSAAIEERQNETITLQKEPICHEH